MASPDLQSIGITTTVPVEILLAGGRRPVDLNNRFIGHEDPEGLCRRAEERGLPTTLCAWIKGIYAWCLEHPELETVLAVTQGDCSNTHVLMELLSLEGRRVVPFGYPLGREPERLGRELERLAGALGTDLAEAEAMRRELAPIRADLGRLDEMCWREGKVSGRENHLWLVSASDFDGDPGLFRERLGGFLDEAATRPPRRSRVRLGVVGVPTILEDLHQVLEELGASVVYNEVPHQFAMLPGPDGPPAGLLEQYLAYTYPYDVFHRARAIAAEARRRGLDGIVHYTQTFCFRQAQDVSLKRLVGLPWLAVEADRAGAVDGRTRTRLEAFVEMLSA